MFVRDSGVGNRLALTKRGGKVGKDGRLEKGEFYE